MEAGVTILPGRRGGCFRLSRPPRALWACIGSLLRHRSWVFGEDEIAIGPSHVDRRVRGDSRKKDLLISPCAGTRSHQITAPSTPIAPLRRSDAVAYL